MCVPVSDCALLSCKLCIMSVVEKIAARFGGEALLKLLSESLTASELNTLLLEVFHRRTQIMTPAGLLNAYQQNRFVRPSTVDALAYAEMTLLWLNAAQTAGFHPLELSPVAPLGACSVLGTVHQHKVLSALRGAEVQADATNALALESSLQRKTMGFPAEPAQFCAVHRHVRTQSLQLPGFTPHFKIFCLSSAGRDTGNFAFEQASLHRHILFYIQFLKEKLGLLNLSVVLKGLDPVEGNNPLFEKVLEALQIAAPDWPLEVLRMPQSSQQYYRNLQFGILWRQNDQLLPIIDGGFVDWTQQLTSNQKERFLISGAGIEFLHKKMNGLA